LFNCKSWQLIPTRRPWSLPAPLWRASPPLFSIVRNNSGPIPLDPHSPHPIATRDKGYPNPFPDLSLGASCCFVFILWAIFIAHRVGFSKNAVEAPYKSPVDSQSTVSFSFPLCQVCVGPPLAQFPPKDSEIPLIETIAPLPVWPPDPQEELRSGTTPGQARARVYIRKALFLLNSCSVPYIFSFSGEFFAPKPTSISGLFPR